MDFFRELWVHRHLVLTLAGRAVKARYAGSVLGLAWAILEPLLQFALFLVVFGVFLGLRGWAPSGTSFALWLLAGLIPFHLLQEGWVRAAGVFRAHAGLVKHVPVPLSVLLVSELVAVLARHAVTLTVLAMVAAVTGQVQLSGVPLFLGGLILVVALLLGGSLWLATAGAYLPDTVPVTSTVMGFVLYLTPILYPLNVVPERWRQLAALNPLFGVVETLRCFLVGGNVSLTAAVVSCFVATVALLGGLGFFCRRQHHIRDLV